MKYIFVILIVFGLFSTSAKALVETVGKVKIVRAIGGYVVFNTCDNSGCKLYYIKPDTDFNKTIISILLTANATEKVVWVGGLDVVGSSWPIGGVTEAYAVEITSNN